MLLLSYHGIPQRYADEGDDYPQRCRDTTRELVSALGLPPEKVMMTFQSRFGREPWLTPYTDETLKCWVKRGLAIFRLCVRDLPRIVWRRWKR